MAISVLNTKVKPWVSQGSEKEIDHEALPKDKEQTSRMHYAAKRDMFIKRRALHNFLNHDAMDDGSTYLRPQKDLFKDPWLFRMELDAGVQAVRPVADNASQTPYYRRVQVAVQAEPPVVDARLQPGKEDPTMEPGMKTFFDKVMPRMLHHLTQNNELPIFGDDYVRLTEDDTFVGSREENYLREAGNFFHHYTRDKQITSIDWRAGNKLIIAVSCIAPHSLGERLDAARNVECAVSIVWNFVDQANPQYILESPSAVLVLKFCPTRPHLIVGGLMNGQVVVWDLTKAPDARSRQSKHAQKVRQPQQQHEDVTTIPPMQAPIKGHTFEKSGDHMVSRLQPSQTSKLEGSHRRAVHDIQWLPAELECSFDGKLVPVAEQNQFATISDDGAMCIWDLRSENLPEHKARKLRQSKHGDDKVWIPLLKFPLQRPDGSGDVLGLRFSLEGQLNGQPSYRMCCTSIEGEFCACNWGPKDERQQQQAFGDDGAPKQAKLIRHLSAAHAGPGWAVQRHPLIPDYYLTVGDWGFKIWKVGLESPILSSPHSDQQVMCGRWSPTRAAVLFIGTKDGWVQVWDLLDRSHEKLFATQVIQEAITVLEFKPPSERKNASLTQPLAVGTMQGQFQLYELPKVLIKQNSTELRMTTQFFEREARRVAYYAWRWKERQKEMDLMMQEKGSDDVTGAAAKKATSAADDDADDGEGEYMLGPDADAAFLEQVNELAKEDEDLS
jgi:WD40 repeat protein